MARGKRARVIDTAKARARGYLNERHPERATRVCDRILKFHRFHSIEDRMASLERAVHMDVSGDQSIHDWETKIWSQNGEDGFLLNLFSRIGATSRRFLEFGCGTGLSNASRPTSRSDSAGPDSCLTRTPPT